MAYTLKTFRDELIEYINEIIYIAAILDNPATPEVNEAVPAVCYKSGIYKNEFNINIDWTPSFPAVFVRIDSVNSEVISGASKTLKQDINFSVYVADKDDALTHVTRIFESLNGCTIDVTAAPLKLNSIDFVDYLPGVEVFRIAGNVSVPFSMT